MFAATLLSTLAAGLSFSDPADIEAIVPEAGRRGFAFSDLLEHPDLLLLGLPYALTVVSILGAHEMGHFLACRIYGVHATWPHFLPSPFFFGTFGAFIRIRSPIPSRRALFDIAVAGPLAGFALTLPALAYGVWSARPGEAPSGGWSIWFGDSLLVRALALLLRGSADTDLWVGQVFLAGWLGQLATCLNLFPVGQLDGGHLMYALSGRSHRRVSSLARRVQIAFLVLLLLEPGGLFRGRFEVTLEGFHNIAPWIVWTALLFIMGDRHPPVLEWQPLGRARRILLLATLLIWIVSFVPVPVKQIPGLP